MTAQHPRCDVAGHLLCQRPIQYLQTYSAGLTAHAAACSGCFQTLGGKTCYKPSVGICDKCSEHGDARWTTSCSGIAQALGVTWTKSLDPTGIPLLSLVLRIPETFGHRP